MIFLKPNIPNTCFLCSVLVSIVCLCIYFNTPRRKMFVIMKSCVKPGLYSVRRSTQTRFAYHFREMDLFYMPRSAEVQKAGNGQRKSRRVVGVFILGICAITTA